MEQIFNYRDIPTDQRLDILNALAQIGFFPAYGGVKQCSGLWKSQFRIRVHNSISFSVKIS